MPRKKRSDLSTMSYKAKRMKDRRRALKNQGEPRRIKQVEQQVISRPETPRSEMRQILLMQNLETQCPAETEHTQQRLNQERVRCLS